MLNSSVQFLFNFLYMVFDLFVLPFLFIEPSFFITMTKANMTYQLDIFLGNISRYYIKLPHLERAPISLFSKLVYIAHIILVYIVPIIFFSFHLAFCSSPFHLLLSSVMALSLSTLCSFRLSALRSRQSDPPYQPKIPIQYKSKSRCLSSNGYLQIRSPINFHHHENFFKLTSDDSHLQKGVSIRVHNVTTLYFCLATKKVLCFSSSSS